MTRLTSFIREEPLNLLLVAVPLAILARFLNWGDVPTFAFSAIAIIPLAGLIGNSTESLSEYSGPRIGGFLNATLGNAAELIITIVAIREGLLDLVKASITGSILGNILFVMGMSFLAGGWKHGEQRFDRQHAGRNSILLLLAVIALVIPSMLSGSIGPSNSVKVEELSLGVAAIMIVLYIAGLIYGYRTAKNRGSSSSRSKPPSKVAAKGKRGGKQKSGPASWSLQTTIIVLVVATVGVVYISEILVGTVEPVVKSLGVSEFFLGIILIPIIGNIAEHLVAVKSAVNNDMDLSTEISISSSLQIALFVAPLLVFISLLLGNQLQLIFNQVELLALIVGVIIAAVVAQDGESNWLEGAELLAVYVILALAFFLLPV
jgi:Ca2+:H+ antiporter